MKKPRDPGAALGRLRSVWEMSPELVEYAYRHRHLNTYVYAALLADKTSAWPRAGRYRLGRGRYPAQVEDVVDQILSHLPAVRADSEPRRVRLALTQLFNELYVVLPRLGMNEVPSYMVLLAALAFLSLAADRADGIPLWHHPPVRDMDLDMQSRFEAVLQPFCFETLADGPFAEELSKRGVQFDVPGAVVNAATIFFVQAVIFAAEDGGDSGKVLRAFQQIERAMRRYEEEHGLHFRPGETLDARRAGRLRYRNTLYLYGGNHLERLGRTAQARRWYLREIDAPELPEFLGFYLTGLKTTERLLRAYPLTPAAEHPRLRRLIERSLAVCLLRTGDYCQGVVDKRRSAPEVDWTRPRLQVDGRTLFFGGEATREPLLAALIYRRIIKGVRYADTDYAVFERVG